MRDAMVCQFNSWTQNHSQGSINTATHQGQVDVQQELLLRSGTTPGPSSSFFFAYRKRLEGGNEAAFERLPYNPKQIARVISFVWGGQLIIGNTVCEAHCP